MTKLVFHGPFHFDDFDANGKFKPGKNTQNAPDPNKPGIYVWGFMYEYKGSTLVKPVDFRNPEPDKKKFIPYYVGLRKNVFNRLKEHKSVRKLNATKYTRLSFNYLKVFFIENDPEDPECPNFPIHIDDKEFSNKIVHLIENDKKKVLYFNNKVALEKIYEEEGIKPITCDGKNYTIICQKTNDGNELHDSLYEIVDTEQMNNFWFCYAIPDENVINLKICETYTFYSLKGKTISKTEKYDKVDPDRVTNNISIHDEYLNAKIFKDQPSKKFPGY